MVIPQGLSLSEPQRLQGLLLGLEPAMLVNSTKTPQMTPSIVFHVSQRM